MAKLISRPRCNPRGPGPKAWAPQGRTAVRTTVGGGMGPRAPMGRAHDPRPMGQDHGPWPKAHLPTMLRIIFQKMNLFQRVMSDFMETKKNCSVITNRYQPVARLDLCYVSENEGKPFFMKMQNLSESLSLREMSMGMSNDYLEALKYKSTYIRVGSKIFGSRT